MRIDIRWIHLVLLLLLVLGGYSGLLGQSDEEEEPAEPEQYAQPKGLPEVLLPSTKAKERISKEYPAICYKWNKKTKKYDPQATCEVWFYWGAYDYTGGHQDGYVLIRKSYVHHYTDRFGNRKARTKAKGINHGDSISNLVKGESAKEMTFKNTPIIHDLPLLSVDGKVQGRAKVGTYTTPIGEKIEGFLFKIRPSRIGQQEWVIACNGPPNQITNGGNCKRHNFDVRYPDLEKGNYRPTIAANSKFMVPIGYQNPEIRPGVRLNHAHPQNHYGTGPMRNAITAIAKQYHAEFSCYKTGSLRYAPIGINDMALSHGGIFDINLNWRTPHSSHHRGKAVDIRCKPGMPNSVIPDQKIINRFLEICEENGLKYAEHEDKGKSNEHCHCGVSRSGEGEIIPQSTQTSGLRRFQQ